MKASTNQRPENGDLIRRRAAHPRQIVRPTARTSPPLTKLRLQVRIFGGVQGLFDTMYLSISFRKSTPPKHRQLNIFIINSNQQVQNFVGELTFLN